MAWLAKVTITGGDGVVRDVVGFSDNIAYTTQAGTRSWWPDHLMTGRKLDIGPVWLRVELGEPYEAIPDVLQFHGPWMVSDMFRKLVEEREPGLHQFFPVEVLLAKGGAEVGPRHVLNIGQRLRAIFVERSNIKWGTRADGSQWPFGNYRDDAHTVSRQAIYGKHLWMDELYRGERYISGDLKDAFERAGLQGLDYVRVREED